MKSIALLCLIACPVFADDCPPVPDHTDQIGALLADLAVAANRAEADMITQDLWALWTDAPDAQAQAMLDQGMQRRAAYDFLGARDVLDGLVAYCPDYAEGYNQRAFASYLRQEFTAALVDIDSALALNPTHIGALSGKALTLMGLGQIDKAQSVLREAVALNPWLRERAFLIEAPGQDI